MFVAAEANTDVATQRSKGWMQDFYKSTHVHIIYEYVSIYYLLWRQQRRLRMRNHAEYLYEHTVWYVYIPTFGCVPDCLTYICTYLCHFSVLACKYVGILLFLSTYIYIHYYYIHLYTLFSRSRLTKQVLATCDSRLLSHLNSFNLISLLLPISTCCIVVRIVVVKLFLLTAAAEQ